MLQTRASGITEQGRYYKVGEFLLPKGAGITKRDNFYYKMGRYYKVGLLLLYSGAGITECGKYYEVGQYIAQLDSQPLVSSDPFTIPIKTNSLVGQTKSVGRDLDRNSGKVLP